MFKKWKGFSRRVDYLRREKGMIKNWKKVSLKIIRVIWKCERKVEMVRACDDVKRGRSTKEDKGI